MTYARGVKDLLCNPRYVITLVSGSEDHTGDRAIGGGYGEQGEPSGLWMVFSSTAVTLKSAAANHSLLYGARGQPGGYYLCRSFAVRADAKQIELSFGADGGPTGIGWGSNALLWLINAIVVHRADSELPPLVQQGLDHSNKLNRLVCRDVWWIGPWDASSGLGLETVYPPERSIAANTSDLRAQSFVSDKVNATLRWQRWQQMEAQSTAPFLNLGQLLQDQRPGVAATGSVAFAWTRVFRSRPGKVHIWCSASGMARVWTASQSGPPTERLVWTGSLITGMHDAATTGPIASVHVPAGWTAVLIKTVHTFGGDFSVGKGGVGKGSAQWGVWVGFEEEARGGGSNITVAKCSGGA